MTQTRDIRIGLGQINPTVGDFRGNQKKILEYIEEAESAGLDLAIFPEMAVCGYPVWDLANRSPFVEAGLKSLKEIASSAKSKHVTVILGFIDHGKKGSQKTRNALAVIQKGKIVFIQHKTLLPTYDVFLEGIFFEPADDYHLLNLNGIKIGTTICEDIWDDQYSKKPLQILKKKGAEIAINISASPYHQNVAHVRDELVCKRAKENKVWLVYVNQVGGQDDLVFDGRSIVADPSGKIIARAPAFQETLETVSIPGNTKLPSIELRKVDVIKEMYEALKLGVRDYVQKNHFKKVVLGLSGGIDSALVATIAADAIGPKSVVGVTMPSEYSSVGSYKDSEALAENLGIEFRKQPIAELYKKFLSQVESRKAERGSEFKPITLANENLQARLRGLELMYISNDENCLLLSTGNKSELAMGYCTLYGDMCGGLAVLGDVYKTDVYKLSKYRNSLGKAIPEATIKKAPSAELRPNQKDQDSLPPYDVLDAILQCYIEQNLGEQEIIRLLAPKGISKNIILETIRKVDFNEYKRRQTPPLIRVTAKAWFGRRMPITNRFGK